MAATHPRFKQKIPLRKKNPPRAEFRVFADRRDQAGSR
jgi:hypothetical protein